MPAPPAGSHSPVLSGNIFPQTLALCSLLTASVPNQAGTMSCREREKERWKNGPERERVRDATEQQKTWTATFDQALEKDSSKGWGPR